MNIGDHTWCQVFGGLKNAGIRDSLHINPWLILQTLMKIEVNKVCFLNLPHANNC